MNKSVNEYLKLLLTLIPENETTGSEKQIDETQIDEKQIDEILLKISASITNLTEEQYGEIQTKLEPLKYNKILKFICDTPFEDAKKLLKPLLDTLHEYLNPKKGSPFEGKEKLLKPLLDTLNKELNPTEGSPFDLTGPMQYGRGKKSIQFGGNTISGQIRDRFLAFHENFPALLPASVGILSSAGLVGYILAEVGLVTTALVIAGVASSGVGVGLCFVLILGWCALPPVINAIKRHFDTFKENNPELFDRLAEVDAEYFLQEVHPQHELAYAIKTDPVHDVKMDSNEVNATNVPIEETRYVVTYPLQGKTVVGQPANRRLLPRILRHWRRGGRTKKNKKTLNIKQKRRIKSKKVSKSKKRV